MYLHCGTRIYFILYNWSRSHRERAQTLTRRDFYTRTVFSRIDPLEQHEIRERILNSISSTNYRLLTMQMTLGLKTPVRDRLPLSISAYIVGLVRG